MAAFVILILHVEGELLKPSLNIKHITSLGPPVYLLHTAFPAQLFSVQCFSVQSVIAFTCTAKEKE